MTEQTQETEDTASTLTTLSGVAYVAFKNADGTEGRGPMVPVKGFDNKQAADDYIDAQPGVMGRREKWSAQAYGDWQVRTFYLFSTAEEALAAEQDDRRKAALKKLTDEEKKLLGLAAG